MKFQSQSRLVEDASRLAEKPSEANRDEDRLSSENNDVLAIGTKILGLKTAAGSYVGIL